MIYLDNIISRLQATGGVSIYYDNIKDRLIRDNIPTTVIDYGEFGTKSSNERFLERYRDCQTGPNKGVFHSSYYRLPVNRNHNIVTTVHDFTYELYNSGPALWVHRWQKNRAIRASDLVICVSENTARDLMRFVPVPENKIRIVHNGVSDSYFMSESIPEKTNEVIFVGARGGYKNFDLAVRAVAGTKSLTLSIVGGGALSEVELATLNKYLPQKYSWLGRLSDEDLNTVYNRAYALIYPSSYEGFGIPVIEAMRAGCPVVTVNASSIPEVAGSAAILVDKTESGELTEALITVDQRRSQLVDAGLVQAGKFSWEKCYQETMKVYNEFA